MFVLDDVIGDTQPQPCSLADGLCGEEGVERSSAGHPGYPRAVVLDFDPDHVTAGARGDLDFSLFLGRPCALIAWGTR